MANMTRDEMRNELKAHGWSRYTDTELAKYLDWALQDIYRNHNFPYVSSRLYSVAGGLVASASALAMSTVTAGTAVLAQIEGIWLEETNIRAWRLRPATQEEYDHLILPNVALDSSNQEVVGSPRMYYVHDLNIYFYPSSDKAYDIRINWTDEQISFSSGAATTGLPERFDQVVVAAAEVICNRRARDFESMAVSQNLVDNFLMSELAKQNTRFDEEFPRVVPYRSRTSTY